MQVVCFRRDTYVFTVGEELDRETAQHLGAILRAVSARRLVVDLSGVCAFDAEDVALLVRASEGRPVAIVANDPRVERALVLTAPALPVHARLADALAG